MSIEMSTEFSAMNIAEAFGVRLHRMLCDEKQQKRWLAYSPHQTIPEENSSVVERKLFELLLMPGLGSDLEKIAFTEILADEFAGSGGLVDMVIDARFGFAWMFSYETRVSLRTISREHLLSAGQLATLLIALVALGSRARNVGYCISCPAADALYVGSSGAVTVAAATGFHAVTENRGQCCAQGFDSASTLQVFKEVGEPDALPLIHEVIQSLRTISADENLLEVCIHLIQEVLIPQRIQLPGRVSQPQSSVEGQIMLSSHTSIPADYLRKNSFKPKLRDLARRFFRPAQ